MDSYLARNNFITIFKFVVLGIHKWLPIQVPILLNIALTSNTQSKSRQMKIMATNSALFYNLRGHLYSFGVGISK